MSAMKTLVVSLILSLLMSCAPNVSTLSKEERIKLMHESPFCMTRRGIVGIEVAFNEAKEVEIMNVLPNSPAYLAQIKNGDILLKIDDQATKSPYDFFRIMRKKLPGESVRLTIRRSGNTIEHQVQTQESFIFNDFLSITEILYKGEPVRLAIVMGTISNTFLGTPQQLDNWKQNIKSTTLSQTEGMVLQVYKNAKNFSLVDRQRTEDLMKEIEMQQTGLISDQRIKLGNMLGATHLMIVDYSRTPPSPPFGQVSDITTRKLIEIETGRTIGSVICQVGY